MLKSTAKLVILLDVPLESYGCYANELLTYLKSLKPEKIILNEDIINVRQFTTYQRRSSDLKTYYSFEYSITRRFWVKVNES